MTNPQFGAPQTHSSQGFSVKENPLRGEQALTIADVTPIIKKAIKGSTQCKLVWINDRETVLDADLNTWLNSVAETECETAEHYATKMINVLYNTLMPLHAEIWWTYTTPEGIDKRIIIQKTQPMFKLNDLMRERIKQS